MKKKIMKIKNVKNYSNINYNTNINKILYLY